MGQVRAFLQSLNEQLRVDLACIGCLGELTDAMVLVPCGHSVCTGCVRHMEASGNTSVLGSDMFCPICKQLSLGNDLCDDDDVVLQPVEAFGNTMMDATLARLRTKVQDILGLLSVVDDLSARMSLER